MSKHPSIGRKDVGVQFRLSRFSAAYRQRLLSGLKDLTVYCQDHKGIRLGSIVKRVRDADLVLAEYVLERHAACR